MTPDPANATNTLTDIGKSGLWAALGIVLTLLGSFLKPLVTGAGSQEKELRDGLAERVDKLEARVIALEAENEKYRQDIITHEKRFLYFYRDRERIRLQRESAREEIRMMRERYGLAPLTWPDDPADPTTF